MSIIKKITNEYEFAEWVKQSDSYSNNFTFEGANALQAYLEEYSSDEDIEFDPIAWCCEYTEYKTALEAYNQLHGEDSEGEGTATGEDNTPENAEAQALEWLNDNTMVIEFDDNTVDGRGIIVQDF